MKDAKKVAGAVARARALSPEDRSAIARKAALARHADGLPRAIAQGVLLLGEAQLACAVLDNKDNTRVLTQEGFLTTIGRAGKAKGGEGASIDGKPAFLRAKNLEPFISSELIASLTPIEFVPLKGPGYQGRAFGFQAKLLPNVCWVYQDAMMAQALLPGQMHIGETCRNVLKALTDHAIDDLVDKATGFEDMRKMAAIYKLLDKCVAEEKLPWVKMFDLDFYKHIYRLNGWPFDPESNARPGVIGHWTNDIYDRLAPGIRVELHARVKRNEKGRPKEKLTQYLTHEDGKPRLKELLEGVKALMRVANDWKNFIDLLDMSYPKFDSIIPLPFPEGLPRLTKPK